MQHDGYNEFRQRGRFDFPIEFHHVDCHHPRFYMPISLAHGVRD